MKTRVTTEPSSTTSEVTVPLGTEAPRVSFAIPLYNEEAAVFELIRRTSAVLNELPGEGHEIVVVDDGSTDATAIRLRELAQTMPSLIVVVLSRNFGHQAALQAALEHVQGDVVLAMDGDLQDTPEALPLFLQKYRAGYDVVFAKRTDRKESWMLRLAYFWAYRLIAMFSPVHLPLDAGDFALLSRKVVDTMNSLPEKQRYLRGLRSWVGFRQIGIPIERQERVAGQSKYSVGRLFELAFDGIFAFTIAPIRLAIAVGLVTVGATLIHGAWVVGVRLKTGQVPAGFTSIILAIGLIGGLQLFFLGILGEYIGRIYFEAKQRPVFLVKEIFQSSGDPDGH